MTETTPKTILKIKKIYSSFRGNYIRIADCVLYNPGLLILDKVSDVAAACNCDNAQIIRFCQKLGFKGFSDMKRAISHDLIPLQTAADNVNEKQNSRFGRMLEDLRKDYSQTINDTAAMCEENNIQKTVEKIKKARKIILCGFGASGIVCEDFQMKLMHMGYSAFFHNDHVMTGMMCAGMEKNDLLIIFSSRGENSETLDCANVAKKNNCSIVTVTNYSNSPAALLSDIVLLTISKGNDSCTESMTSRLSQLMLVDILSGMLALNNRRKMEKNPVRDCTVSEDN